jgi:hypothetical protein
LGVGFLNSIKFRVLKVLDHYIKIYDLTFLTFLKNSLYVNSYVNTYTNVKTYVSSDFLSNLNNETVSSIIVNKSVSIELENYKFS